MKSFLISPPFGNILTHRKCTSVRGTFTLHPRGSNLTKLYRLLKTTRLVTGGWVNKVGFQNPGIHSVRNFRNDAIYSIAAMEIADWDELFEVIPAHVQLELNLSCPNIGKETVITDAQIRSCVSKYTNPILKLSPSGDTLAEVDRFVALGVTHFHLFNTLPVAQGGESGARVKERSLAMIPVVKKWHPHITVIGGGGIYTVADVEDYRTAGADRYSLSSIFLNPFKAARLLYKI